MLMLQPGDLVRVGCDPRWSFDWQRKAATQGVIFKIKDIYRRPDILMAQIKSQDGVAHWLPTVCDCVSRALRGASG